VGTAPSHPPGGRALLLPCSFHLRLLFSCTGVVRRDAVHLPLPPPPDLSFSRASLLHRTSPPWQGGLAPFYTSPSPLPAIICVEVVRRDE